METDTQKLVLCSGILLMAGSGLNSCSKRNEKADSDLQEDVL